MLGAASLNPAAAAVDHLGGSFTMAPMSTSSAVIDALELEGIVRTLAEPNLTAVSGQNARFHAGGELPIANCQIASSNNALHRRVQALWRVA